MSQNNNVTKSQTGVLLFLLFHVFLHCRVNFSEKNSRLIPNLNSPLSTYRKKGKMTSFKAEMTLFL